jgi:hypothetical protein
MSLCDTPKHENEPSPVRRLTDTLSPRERAGIEHWVTALSPRERGGPRYIGVGEGSRPKFSAQQPCRFALLLRFTVFRHRASVHRKHSRMTLPLLYMGSAQFITSQTSR